MEEPSPEVHALEEAKEKLLAKRVGMVVMKLRPIEGRR